MEEKLEDKIAAAVNDVLHMATDENGMIVTERLDKVLHCLVALPAFLIGNISGVDPEYLAYITKVATTAMKKGQEEKEARSQGEATS